MAGITRELEQSKVPCVSTRIIVGILAWAIDTRGEYPPLAVILTICFPSATETLFTGDTGPVLEFDVLDELFESTIAPPIRIPATIMDIIVNLIPIVKNGIVLPCSRFWHCAVGAGQSLMPKFTTGSTNGVSF